MVTAPTERASWVAAHPTPPESNFIDYWTSFEQYKWHEAYSVSLTAWSIRDVVLLLLWGRWSLLQLWSHPFGDNTDDQWKMCSMSASSLEGCGNCILRQVIWNTGTHLNSELQCWKPAATNFLNYSTLWKFPKCLCLFIFFATRSLVVCNVTNIWHLSTVSFLCYMQIMLDLVAMKLGKIKKDLQWIKQYILWTRQITLNLVAWITVIFSIH